MDIVVVAYGPHDRLRRCLGSLRARPPSRPHGVTVVDNSPDPHTKTAVESVLPSATVISSRANLDFTRAGTTAGLRSPRLVWAFHYGMFRFYRMHYAPSRSRAVNGIVYAGIGTRAALVLAWTVALRPLRRRVETPDATVPEQSDRIASEGRRTTQSA